MIVFESLLVRVVGAVVGCHQSFVLSLRECRDMIAASQRWVHLQYWCRSLDHLAFMPSVRATCMSRDSARLVARPASAPASRNVRAARAPRQLGEAQSRIASISSAVAGFRATQCKDQAPRADPAAASERSSAMTTPRDNRAALLHRARISAVGTGRPSSGPHDTRCFSRPSPTAHSPVLLCERATGRVGEARAPDCL